MDLLLSDSPWNMQLSVVIHTSVTQTKLLSSSRSKLPLRSFRLTLIFFARALWRVHQSRIDWVVMQLNWHEHIIGVKHATRRIWSVVGYVLTWQSIKLRRSSFDYPWRMLLHLSFTNFNKQASSLAHAESVVSSRTGLFITIHRGVS